MPNEFGFTAAEIISGQRTEKGLAYERRLKALRTVTGEKRERLDASVLAIKSVGPAAVHSNTILSSMSVAYANDAYIGVQLMPIAPVGKRSDAYATYPKEDRLAFPDDSLASRSSAAELDESRGTANYSVNDYGFKNFVSADTVENEDGAFDEMLDLQAAVDDAVAFKEEKRIATIVTTTSNYASGNFTTLSGTSQWNSTGSDPVANLLDAGSALWQGHGQTRLVAFCGLEVFNVLCRHPAIRDLFRYTGEGLATRQMIANFFGWDELLIGSAREDTANKGQATRAYGRIWGKNFGLLRVAVRPTKRSAHFGTTFRLRNDPVATQWFEPDSGKGGGYYYRCALSEDHKVVANDAGYLIAAAVS